MLKQADYNRFSDFFFRLLNTINHLNMKLFIFIGILQVIKFEFLKFRISEILNFHPCCCGNIFLGAQWFSEIVGLWLVETHGGHCVVILSKTLYHLLSAALIQAPRF